MYLRFFFNTLKFFNIYHLNTDTCQRLFHSSKPPGRRIPVLLKDTYPNFFDSFQSLIVVFFISFLEIEISLLVLICFLSCNRLP